MKKKLTCIILGNNVKYYRFKNGFSQKLLAEKNNLRPRYVSDIENGKGNISIYTLENIATVLKIKPSLLYLVGGVISGLSAINRYKKMKEQEMS